MRRRRDQPRISVGIVALSMTVGVVIAVTVGVAMRSSDADAVTASPVSVASTTTTSAAPPSTTTTTPPSTTTTTPPTTTTTEPPAAPDPALPSLPSYRTGDAGPEVAALQQRLVDLGIWLPAVDGEYGSMTAQGVMAFQKFIGLGRDGVAGPATLDALATSPPVGPREGGDHVEVDLERQIMFVVRDGRSHVFNTSSGRSGWRTPAGRFTVTRQIDGVRRAPLGDLYRPKYFNGGIALHGSPSIPGQPASHGCTRLHDAVVDHIWSADLVPIGTPVWVY